MEVLLISCPWLAPSPVRFTHSIKLLLLIIKVALGAAMVDPLFNVVANQNTSL
jgi:hypothetical protein